MKTLQYDTKNDNPEKNPVLKRLMGTYPVLKKIEEIKYGVVGRLYVFRVV